MRSTYFRTLFLGTLLFSCLSLTANAATINATGAIIPEPVGFVNDFAQILSPQQRQQLEARLDAYEKETSNEVIVAIFPKLVDQDAFTYSQTLFTKWGVGKKGKDNGVLLLLGPKEGFPFPERGELFINVGRGLEGSLTDSVTGTIERQYIFPAFKEQKIYEGLDAGVTQIMNAIKGEFTADAESDKATNPVPLSLILYAIFFVPIYITSFLARSKTWWLGGLIGGVIGGVGGVYLLSGWLIAASVLGLGGLGLLFDFLVSKNYATRKERGLPTSFWHSGGGFWGGGRGGFGGGGFGGFGGGSSGGGGAGGSW
ncbi:TPM domain-containing protein [Candidatus Gracilibacteria bacterium]|nr:TPM domain-containing protein [Candidatus Gracilibacteria bacterium]